MADILLTVGISLESLRQAKTQIDAELKTWKTPPAEIITPETSKKSEKRRRW